MKTINFKNKVCWITGASSGIGAEVAHSLNAAGARLILSSRSSENLQKVKDGCEFPENVQIHTCDMELSDQLAAKTSEAWAIFNGIDYVFLNAGIAIRDMIMNTDMDMMNKVMNVNFFSNVIISKTLLPMMKERGAGCFVVTSSLCGKFGVPKLAGYAASKHALHGFFESLRAEYEDFGIRVTIITAGLVRTNITMNALQGDGRKYGKMQESVAHGISAKNCAIHMMRAVAAGKNEALVGGFERFSVLVKRFFPGLVAMAIGKHPMRRVRTMFSFTRKKTQREILPALETVS